MSSTPERSDSGNDRRELISSSEGQIRSPFSERRCGDRNEHRVPDNPDNYLRTVRLPLRRRDVDEPNEFRG